MWGTDALGRPFTDAERDRFEELLLRHDLPHVWVIALRYGLKLVWKNLGRAEDLVGRANVRLVRSGWEPERVALVGAFCRLVWSEWTNELRERETQREAERGYLRERRTYRGHLTRDIEERAIELEDELRNEAAAKARDDARLATLIERFEKAGDAVNLLWLDFARRGIESPSQIARESGCEVRELYRAADRRKRHVKQILEEP